MNAQHPFQTTNGVAGSETRRSVQYTRSWQAASPGPPIPPYLATTRHSMRSLTPFLAAVSALCLAATASLAEITVLVEHNDNEHARADFNFKSVPAPSRTDAAGQAQFSIADGEPDHNGGSLSVLHDGRVPAEADEPAENFFFNAGTDGGTVLVDLGSELELQQVNTYSWHPNSRGPQVYKLYAGQGRGADFNARPKRGTDPENSGWKLLARVDTRPKEGGGGGQCGVSISDPQGAIGKYRYLLFDISRTEADDAFGNTFYSEIDVVAKGVTAKAADPGSAAPAATRALVIQSSDGHCEITIDTSAAPDLKEWAEQKLAPVLAAWYPKIVAMLPSEGYTAPKRFSVSIRPGRGVAATSGTRITANSDWAKRELDGEATGALVHEVVHVVQQYRGRRGNPDYRPAPGWLVEGICDYIRWFLYEPQSHGADVTWLRARRNVALKHDASYRITANFLNYVVQHHDPKQELITRLNAACRQGRYTDDLWKDCTGKTLLELSDEWKTATEQQLRAGNPASADREQGT